MQLKNLRLEILSTFSWGFWVFEAHFVIKILLIKKFYKLVNAFKSSILLLLGFTIILETLLKNLRKGAQSSGKLQGWGLQLFKKANSSIGDFEDATQICISFFKSLNQSFIMTHCSSLPLSFDPNFSEIENTFQRYSGVICDWWLISQ